MVHYVTNAQVMDAVSQAKDGDWGPLDLIVRQICRGITAKFHEKRHDVFEDLVIEVEITTMKYIDNIDKNKNPFSYISNIVSSRFFRMHKDEMAEIAARHRMFNNLNYARKGTRRQNMVGSSARTIQGKGSIVPSS